MKPVKFAFAAATLLAIVAAVFVVRARQSPSAKEIITRQSPSAEEIIVKMKNAYATCRTYRDRGTCKYSDKATSFFEEGDFVTAFVRPEQFCFHLTRTLRDRRSVTYIAWLHGKKSRLWNGLDKTDEAKAFYLSIARATVVSANATYNMTFLFPSGKYGPRFHAVDAKRIGDAKAEGEDCYCLQIARDLPDVFGKYVQKFYVSKATFLLRKMEDDAQSNVPSEGKMTMHSEVIWKPVINEDIPASALEYNPPR